ncbi:MAG: collagen-like protein, partial [Nitrosopumilus sp.]
MSSQSRLEIQGQAPFKQSGVYETQIAIVGSKPSDEQIKSKQFTSLWRGNFHLRVKDGMFSEKIGTPENPIPSSVLELETIWIVVTDLFSSLHSVFDVPLSKPNTSKPSESKPNTSKPSESKP